MKLIDSAELICYMTEKSGLIRLFKNVSPNAITLSNVPINIILVYGINHNWYGVGFLLFLRWFMDSLDGYVAFKYDKASKLGALLDTSADMMFYFSMNAMFNRYSRCLAVMWSFGIMIFFVYFIKIKAHWDHDVCDRHIVLKFLRNYDYTVYTIFYLLYHFSNPRFTVGAQ